MTEKPRKKKGLVTDLQAQIAAEIDSFFGKETSADCDLGHLELGIRKTALRLAAQALETQLNADHSDYAGPLRLCTCGAHAHYQGRRKKIMTTVLGTISIRRAYYLCPECHRGLFPRDRLLGCTDSGLSPAVTRMVGLTAATVSFAESAEMLSELAGLSLDAKQIERTAEALGIEISQDEYSNVQTAPPCASTMYLGLDGTGVPMRPTEVEGRDGKQTDGSAKTREVKLAVVWSAESRNAEGQPQRDPGSVSYSAAIESAADDDTASGLSVVAQRAMREAKRRGFTHASRQVIIGDGAPWIWNIATELFPDAIQIVDRYHVKEHLAKVAKSIFGPESSLVKGWQDERFQELDDGRLMELMAILNSHAKNNDDARKCRDYIERNKDRMRYAQFKAMGLCTSSGVVEAGCKVVVGTRLKRSGMRWTVKGANAITALRCNKLSGRYPSFWQRRIARLQVAA